MKFRKFSQSSLSLNLSSENGPFRRLRGLSRYVSPVATAALGLSLFAVSGMQVGAVNVEGPTVCYNKCKTCDESRGWFSYMVPASESCPETKSFSWGVAVGKARVGRFDSFVNMSRVGAVEGVIRGDMRTFEEVFSDQFNTDPVNVEDVLLEMNLPEITADVLDPAVLEIHHTGNFTRIDDAGFINQVISENAFGHVDKLAEGFRIRIWNKADIALVKNGKLYDVPVGVEPVQDVVFSKLAGVNDPGQFLLISKERFGAMGTRTITQHYHRNSTTDETVILTYEGEGTGGTVIAKEVVSYSARGARAWDYSIERQNFQASLDATGTYGALVKTAHTKEVYEDFSPAGESGKRGARRMVSRVTDFGGANLTTTYAFYPQNGNPYVSGRLKSVVHPDGSWVYNEYVDAHGTAVATIKRYSSWKDVTLANRTQGALEEMVLEKNALTRTKSVGGVQISKVRYETEKNDAGETILTSKLWDGSEWAVSRQCYYPDEAAEPNAGKIKWVENADGTAVNYLYETNATGLEITVRSGAGDRSGITAGREVVHQLNASFQAISEYVSDIATDTVVEVKQADLSHGVDNFGSPLKWIYNGDVDDYSITQYGCCGLEFSRDRSGATMTYAKDALKRTYRVLEQRSSGGVTVSTATAHDGLTTRTERSVVGEAGTELLVSESTRSLSGLSYTMKSPDADGDGNAEVSSRVTVYGAGGGSTTMNTAPDGSVTSTVSFVDGSTKSSTDAAGNVTSYDKGVHALNGGGLFSLTTAANGTQTSKRYSDQLGRTFRVETADGAYSEMEYFGFDNVAAGSRGKLMVTKDADEVATAGKGMHVSYEYNGEGDRVKVSSKVAGGQTVVQTSDQDVVSDAFAGNAYRSRSWVNGVLTSTSLQSGDGYRSKSLTLAGTATSERSVPVDGSWTVTSTGADGVQSRQFYSDGLMKASVVFESGATLPSTAPADITAVSDAGFMSGMSSGHDGFGRVTSQTDSRTGTYTMTLLENGAVGSLTDAGGRVTASVFDKMGRTVEVDAPDTLDKDGNAISNRTFTSYYATGQVKGVWGDQTYARFNVYDSLNRLVELRTYQGLAHGTEPTASTTGFAKTNWNYNGQRGWLDNKRYDDGKGTDYEYTVAGRLKKRTWARGISTTYSYDAGMLVLTDYSDGTADVAYSYDGFGRQSTVTQGAGAAANTHVYQYDAGTLQLASETVSYGSSMSRELMRSYDSILRPSGWELKNGSGVVENEVGYVYDSAGRLGGVSTSFPAAANPEFAYGYKAKSGGLLETVSGPAHTVTNQYEATRNVLNVKTNATLADPAVVVSAFDYSVNDLGQRDDVAASGNAFAAPYTRGFKYDAKGQVIRENHTTDDTKDRAFEFDGIGNRLKSADSLTLPASNNYVANALNQYSTALGVARPAASHDDDGNLVDDGTKTYVWDGENRLLSVSDASGVLVSYTYDYLSRRITKNETGGSNVTFVYDGWNPVAVYSGSVLSKTYTWGMDLSGSMQGAGGVGGLLAVKEALSGDSYYPTYDGNGNVSEYLDSMGTVVAHYEYDAFGRATVSTGAKKDDFVHRFSTKQRDAVGLYYYGYRYYQPEVGRWLGRDIISSNEFIYRMTMDTNMYDGDLKSVKNLWIRNERNSDGYQFLQNASVFEVDAFGLIACYCPTTSWSAKSPKKGCRPGDGRFYFTTISCKSVLEGTDIENAFCSAYCVSKACVRKRWFECTKDGKTMVPTKPSVIHRECILKKNK